MATNFIPLTNSASEVSPIGRVVRKGLRYNDTGKQPVINVKVVMKRSYKPQAEGSAWVNVDQYYDLALWGDRATTLKTALERYGDLASLTETHEIRVKSTFSLADVTVKPWGGEAGQAAKFDLNVRASAIEIVSITAANFHGTNEGSFVGAPDPDAEVEFAL